MIEKDRKIKVWDPIVRIFHWSLVSIFLIALITGEDGEGFHVTAGYIIIGLILFRIIWGFIGTKHARFTDFVRGPGAVKDYLKGLLSGRHERYLGHNPAGGAMIVVLLISVLLVSYSGLKLYAAEEGRGIFADGGISLVSAAYASDDHSYDGWKKNTLYLAKKRHDREEFWEEVHEVFVGFTLFFIFLHITGVVMTSVIDKENLVLSMITGEKRTLTGSDRTRPEPTGKKKSFHPEGHQDNRSISK